MSDETKYCDRGQLETLITAKAKADRDYNKGFADFMEGVPLLDVHRFWEILPRYLSLVIEFCFGYERTNGVRQAADEMFRKTWIWTGETKEYTFEEMIQFAKTYPEMKSKLYEPLFGIITDKGDDGYGDLMDNLPLVGQELFEALQRKDYGNNLTVVNKVTDAITKFIKDTKVCYAERDNLNAKLTKFIWEGENYHSMCLNDACKKYLVSYTVDKDGC